MPTAPPGKPTLVALGWDRPMMASAAEWFRTAFPPRGRVWDLGAVTVVPQGGRAGRIFEAMLVDRAGEHGLGLIPPLRVGPGEIADALIHRAGRPAPPIVRQFTWDAALRAVPSRVIEPFLRRAPQTHAHRMAIAAVLDRLHSELAGEMISFADVPDRARGVPSFDEADRWRAGAAVQEKYLELLSQAGWVDASDARVRAIREGRVGQRTSPIVLVGVAELPGVARGALERCGAPLTALVCAPSELLARFDAWGHPTSWWATDHIIDIPDSSIRFVDSPADQGGAAIEAIAEITRSPSPDEIVIGAPDESVVPSVCRWLAELGAFGRPAPGTPASRTRPVRLVTAAAAVAEDPSWAPVGALVRHPDVSDRLDAIVGNDSGHGWLAAMDAHRTERVPAVAMGSADHVTDGDGLAVRAALAAVAGLMGELLPSDYDQLPRAAASAWCPHIAAMLDRVMPPESDVGAHDAREAADAIDAIQRALEQMTGLAGSALDPGITAGEALRVVADHAGRDAIPSVPRENAVDLVGWLELASDPARIVIVTGMNEGVVPSTVPHDPVLPDGLRAALGLSSDATRVARDSYLIEVIARQGREARFISGRRSSDGDPLTPSRLVMRPPSDRLGTRVLRFMSGKGDTRGSTHVRSLIQAGGRDLFPTRPVQDRVREMTSVSVTAFRAYMESPYLFYLTHVLGLREATDADPELTPGGFGSLVHEAMRRFATHPGANQTDAKRVEKALLECLEGASESMLGSRPVLAARMQVELARRRLERFAPAQAARRGAGWVIEHAEWSAPSPGEPGAPVLHVDGVPMGLRGTIDRIERHESTGEYAIIDYKTGDSVTDPDKAHRKGRPEKRWIDLQLPLYALIAAEIIGDRPMRVGYAVLPSDAPDDPFAFAPWTPGDFEAAQAAASDIVRAIRAGQFRTLGSPTPRNPVLAALLRVDRESAGEDGEAGEAGSEGAS